MKQNMANFSLGVFFFPKLVYGRNLVLYWKQATIVVKRTSWEVVNVYVSIKHIFQMRVPEEVYGSDLQGMDFKNQYIIHTLRENLQ